mgnify:CR=1 FL=1
MPFRVTFFAAHAIICIIIVYPEKEEQILEFLHLNATFGRLEQHELHLHSGLNLICAPNESGKSTWGSFICAMLYGLSTRDRGLMADKNRFAPWSGAAMQGRMDILSDGRALTLQRDTRRANAPMGNFSCTYTGTGTPVEGITAQNAGEQLLGVPRDVWERSAFIGQNALAVSQSAELERRISSLITTGEEDASFTESYERLKKQLNRRKHNKTGQIPVLERDIAQLHQSLQELDALEQQARQAQEEVSALTQRVDGLRHQAAQQQAQIRQERINAWHRAARTAEEAQRRADILLCNLIVIIERASLKHDLQRLEAAAVIKLDESKVFQVADGSDPAADSDLLPIKSGSVGKYTGNFLMLHNGTFPFFVPGGTHNCE